MERSERMMMLSKRMLEVMDHTSMPTADWWVVAYKNKTIMANAGGIETILLPMSQKLGLTGVLRDD